jgi:DNA-binding MurR/RpiR family transcriptional regulator
VTGHDRPGGRRAADAALLAALAAGATRDDAAAAAGVSPSTVYRRLGEPDFVAALDARRADMVESATARLVSTTTAAVDTLAELLDDDRPSIRLGAARAVLEHARRWIDGEDIARRIEALEARLAQIGDRP